MADDRGWSARVYRFCCGPDYFWDPLSRWLARQTAPKAAVVEIAQHYREFVNIFESVRSTPALRN